MKETLLQKAKKIVPKQDIVYTFPTDEELEVVVAFLNGEIGWAQTGAVLKGLINAKGSTNYGRITTILRFGIKKGKIKIIIKK